MKKTAPVPNHQSPAAKSTGNRFTEELNEARETLNDINLYLMMFKFLIQRITGHEIVIEGARAAEIPYEIKKAIKKTWSELEFELLIERTKDKIKINEETTTKIDSEIKRIWSECREADKSLALLLLHAKRKFYIGDTFADNGDDGWRLKEEWYVKQATKDGDFVREKKEETPVDIDFESYYERQLEEHSNQKPQDIINDVIENMIDQISTHHKIKRLLDHTDKQKASLNLLLTQFIQLIDKSGKKLFQKKGPAAAQDTNGCTKSDENTTDVKLPPDAAAEASAGAGAIQLKESTSDIGGPVETRASSLFNSAAQRPEKEKEEEEVSVAPSQPSCCIVS
jgi:hypothetical protein